MDITKSLLILFLCACINLGYIHGFKSNFNTMWFFILEDDIPSLIENSGDSSWKSLKVPHECSFVKGMKIIGERGQRGGYHEGSIGWYGKSLNVNNHSLCNINYINFAGVSKFSEVSFSDHNLAKRSYGYYRLINDLSKSLKAGKTTISERVVNSLEPSAQWYQPSGNYAPTNIIEVHSKYLISNRIIIETPFIQDNKAEVSIDPGIYGV